MENPWVKKSVSNFFTDCRDIFGDKSTFVGFEADESTTLRNQASQDGLNSIQLYGTIVYKDKNGNIRKSAAIMFKLTPKIKHSKFISYSFFNELNFYTKIVPVLSTLDKSFVSLFPQFFYGEMVFNVKEDKSVIILEDLKAKGYKMTEKKSFLDRAHLIIMMRKLGQFHAYSYKAKRDIPQLFYPLANNCTETNPLVNMEMCNFLPHLAQRGFQHLIQKDPSYRVYAPKIESMLENVDDKCVEYLTGDVKNPNSVIIHGDYLRNNVMFQYENNVPQDMIFMDLATYRFASPVIDLLTVLYLNTDQKIRDELWDTLIDEYYEALKSTFPKDKVPEKEEILGEFVDRAFYAYLIASHFLPILIANDAADGATVSDARNFMKSGRHEMGFHELPKEVLIKAVLGKGGEAGTKALSDVLQDIIDRGFICK
ncbi:uncharacterized protein LOC135846990 [Planococcus citri]|uniref:uncharacterized protein LOC135846990 n=1 Tax=Planococcus citri TaxID=170843 RepID=UPI0031F752FA